MAKRVGVLTGGGDTSALNATLKGVALAAENASWEVVGIEEGWAGLLDGRMAVRLPAAAIDADRGGTILRSSRTNLRAIEGGVAQAAEHLDALELDALIAVGGDDTLSVGVELDRARPDAPINFVTKTIDNDVGTNSPEGGPYDFGAMRNYLCPGFPTAAAWLRRAAQDLRTTAYSHERIVVLEAMGRTAGWLALSTALGHADFVVIPEVPLQLDALVELVAERFARQRNVVMTIAEGAELPNGTRISDLVSYAVADGRSGADEDAFGHRRLGGACLWVVERLKEEIGERRGLVRPANISGLIPSYLQRCGSPTPIDRDIAVRLGRAAMQATLDGETSRVASPVLRDGRIDVASLEVGDVLPLDSSGTIIPRTVDARLYDPHTFAPTADGLGYFEPIIGPFTQPYRDATLEAYSP